MRNVEVCMVFLLNMPGRQSENWLTPGMPRSLESTASLNFGSLDRDSRPPPSVQPPLGYFLNYLPKSTQHHVFKMISIKRQAINTTPDLATPPKRSYSPICLGGAPADTPPFTPTNLNLSGPALNTSATTLPSPSFPRTAPHPSCSGLTLDHGHKPCRAVHHHLHQR